MAQRNKTSRKRGDKRFGTLPFKTVEAVTAQINKVFEARRKLGIRPDANVYVPLKREE